MIAHFGLRAVIGKGGMGPKTLAACQEHGAVYLHAIGGAATLIASYVKEVLAVYKKDELGVPEAFWVIRVEGFPAVVDDGQPRRKPARAHVCGRVRAKAGPVAEVVQLSVVSPEVFKLAADN